MHFFTSVIEYPALDPVVVRLGPLAVRWYGLAYVAGIVLGYFGLKRMARSGHLRLAHDQVADLLCWLAAGVVLGGRIGWWLFYHRSEGAVEPWYEPLAIWHGGMSFHGGLIGVGLALGAWSWRSRAPVLNIADCLALVAPVGLFFGRVANFINAELVGRPADLPWAVIFPGESFARHPSQLYEAVLEGPVLLLLLWAATIRRSFEGQAATLFLLGYGLFRFLVEFTREPDEQLGFIAFGWLTMGQVLSATMAALGLSIHALLHWRGKRAAQREAPTMPWAS